MKLNQLYETESIVAKQTIGICGRCVGIGAFEAALQPLKIQEKRGNDEAVGERPVRPHAAAGKCRAIFALASAWSIDIVFRNRTRIDSPSSNRDERL